jgi:hypothetical protein
MPDDRILLDTTVQLWRIAGGPEEAGKFHQELSGEEKVFSTSFVFREFLNTIIADVEYVHRLAASNLQPEEDGRVGLGQLARFLATGKGNYSARSIRRLHLVIGMILESFEQTSVPKSKLLVRLERTANRFIRDFFRRPGRDGDLRPIDCLTGLDEPGELEEMREARPFPQPPRFPRAAGQFLESRKTQVVRVEEEMKKSTKARGRDDKLLQGLEWLKARDGSFDFPTKLATPKRWNWALGDLLIALETPEGVAIYSTDRAFAILCRALEKPRHEGYRVPGLEKAAGG